MHVVSTKVSATIFKKIETEQKSLNHESRSETLRHILNEYFGVFNLENRRE